LGEKIAIVNQRTRKGVFEISSANGLINDYALCKARGEGGKPDPKLMVKPGGRSPAKRRRNGD